MNFICNTEAQKKDMLKELGVSGIDALFRDIPKEIVLKKGAGNGLSEAELAASISRLSKKNKTGLVSFLGAGSYNHFIPAAVRHIVSRSEFYTAYTPYQAEMSQGMLQAIYEYQTMIAELTGMDVANASVYDGATALAEACIMACTITRKKKVVMPKSVHPEHREVVKTYCEAHDFLLEETEEPDENTAALLIQNPDFFGNIKDISKIEKGNALVIMSVVEASSLGLLKTEGADIVVGEGQSFGNALHFGGPYLGIMATKDKYKRYLPGRLVGKTLDAEGEEGFILTLQAREQHIRRERACSNICSNEALCALAAAVQLALLGKNGLGELTKLNWQKAHYMADLLKTKLVFDHDFYNEFVIRVKDARAVNEALLKDGIIGGLELEKLYPEMKGCLLFCVTEMIKKQDIDRAVDIINETDI